MSRLLHVHPQAAAEAGEAAAWYEAQRAGLGLEFLAAVDHAIDSVQESPMLYPVWRPNHPWRRSVVRRFPYVVFYEVEEERVIVMAVAHAKRHPGYWVTRRRQTQTPA